MAILWLRPAHASAQAAAASAHAVQELRPHRCRGCGELESVQGSCPQLRTVDAQFCHSLSDRALQQLCACAPGLASLLLPYCTSMTCAALSALGGASRLQTLDLSFTGLQVLLLTAVTRHACCQQPSKQE